MKIKNQIQDFQKHYCPYAYLDIEFCLEVASSIDKDVDWLLDLIDNAKEEFCESYENIDPCVVIYDHIFQLARTEIEELTGYDIEQDFNVAGNFMRTSFDYNNQEAVDNLHELLSTKNIEKDTLSLESQYFLNEVIDL